MIEGVLHHCTDMNVEKNYVDSHGQSEVAFAFCHLLGFQLLPLWLVAAAAHDMRSISANKEEE
jgi:TnpA family transposase